MKVKLNRKIFISYAFLVSICILSIIFIVNHTIQQQFKSYIISNHEKKQEQIISSIAKQYLSNNEWDIYTIETVGMHYLEQGLIVKLKDMNNDTLVDISKHNNEICQQILSQMETNMNKQFKNWEGEYTEKEYPVFVENKKVGTIIIGYYGPFYYSDYDLFFIRTLNSTIVVIGIILFVISLLLSYTLSKNISSPINRIFKSIEKISKGNYSNKISCSSDVIEINNLINSVNNLSTALETQELLRKKLTTDMSHELRTPLTNLQGNLEALVDGIWKPTPDRLESCLEEVLRITRMAEDLNKLAKYESENIVLNKEELVVSEIIKKVLISFENEFRSKNITVNLKEDMSKTYVDKDKIIQVFMNLISNATKYMDNDGKVDINIESKNDKCISISVSDTGVGISEEDLPYIFERFYRVDKSRTRATGGTGIGLTITKAIVEAHDGRIVVSSKVGEGSTFTVELPLII